VKKSAKQLKCIKIEQAMIEIFNTSRINKSNRTRGHRHAPQGEIIAEICDRYGLNIDFIKKLGGWIK